MTRIILNSDVCRNIVKNGTEDVLDLRQRFTNRKKDPWFYEGHLLGIVKRKFTQNANRDATCAVNVNGYEFACESPLSKEGDVLEAGQRVFISINRLTRRWQIIAGEC